MQQAVHRLTVATAGPGLYDVTEKLAAWVGAQPGWRVIGITESPITGPAGNREFLLYARR